MKKIISNLDYTMNISSLDEGVADTSRVISTSRKHKKQETTHFNEHKKGNKSTKKEEKETRDNLKVKIGVLSIPSSNGEIFIVL